MDIAPKEIPVAEIRDLLATLKDEAFKSNRDSYANDLITILAYAQAQGANKPALVGGYKALETPEKPIACPTREEACQLLQDALDQAETVGDTGKATAGANWAQIIALVLALLQQMHGGGPGPKAAEVAPAAAVATEGELVNSVTALEVNPAMSTEGETIVLFATVTPEHWQTGKPSGTVQFFNETVMLGSVTLYGGNAELQVANLPSGTASVVANYSGDAAFNKSSSPPVSVTVHPATPV